MRMRDIFRKICVLFNYKNLYKSAPVIREEGVSIFFKKVRLYVKRHFTNSYLISDYSKWISMQRQGIMRWYRSNGKKISIIIPSYNDASYLRNCIRSLQDTVKDSQAEIVIVDDASTDSDHIKFLKGLSNSDIKIIFRNENGGFAKTINTGLQGIKNSDVILLNSDIIAKQTWLEALQYAAYQDERIGIVSPKLLYPDGKIQFAGLPRNIFAPDWFDHYYRFLPSSFGPANIPNKMLFVTGACMYIKRQVLDDIGYFDENFDMGFEDIDYCLRAWRKNYTVLYFPFSELIHYESVTCDNRVGKKRSIHSKEYFWEKWSEWFDKRNVKFANGQLRIIYVLESTGVAGGHRIVFEHLNRLQKAGLSVELYTLKEKPEWIPLHVPVKTFTNYQSLIDDLKEQEAIKVATWWNTSEPVWLASIQKGIPVYFVQDIESSYYPNDQIMQMNVLSKYKKEFRYLTISRWNCDELKKMALYPTIVPCGIDGTVFKPLNEKRLPNVLLTAGRSHYLKNLQLTLDAWSQIRNNQPKLWMYGVEPELGKRLNNCEYFYKPDDGEINKLLNRATAFVLTSRHEGFALTILEAMAAGAPVICTDADGNRDFCVDGKNCLMVRQDDLKGLKSAIKTLFNNPELQNQLREEGYKTAAQYEWANVIPRLVQFYEDVAGGRTTPPSPPH